MEGTTCQTIYASKVPKSRFSVATAIELLVLLLIIIGTIVFPVPIASNSVFGLLFFIVIEGFLLLRLLDLFLWHNFGQEKNHDRGWPTDCREPQPTVSQGPIHPSQRDRPS